MMASEFFNFRQRLALFRESATEADFWERKWASHDILGLLRQYQSGQLDEFDAIFRRHLPREGPIIEAGCGMGQLVVALRARGYETEGLDYAEETVKRAREAMPALPVRVGDICAIDRPCGYYHGYISIGVVEHDPAGPGAGLREARRVLRPGGIALISVPYLNWKRRRLKRTAKTVSCTEVEGKTLYQYYFSVLDFRTELEAAGFDLLEFFPYAAYSGLTRDFILGRFLERHGFFAYRVQSSLFRYCARAPSRFRTRFAHMAMFACRAVG